MTDRSFERANDQSRERLARLVATLTPVHLSVDLGEGWTVASALAHTGFWDRWQAERWTEILAGTWTADDESVLTAEHLANESLHPYWSGISATNIGALAVDAAIRLDALVAQAPDTLVDSLEGGPSAYLLHRHRHRGDHIDHIERVLAAEAGEEDARPWDGSYIERNAASRRRLVSTLESLEEADLALRIEADGWTVAQVLGHLSFWDRFLAVRWQVALAGVPGTQPAPLPDGLADLLNQALAPGWAALSGAGSAAVDEAVAAAEAVDAILADIPEATAIASLAGRTPIDRSIHRNEHLDAIDLALTRRRRP